MPQFLVMTEEEATALWKATDTPPGGNWIRPVLIESGANAGLYSISPECLEDKAYADLLPVLSKFTERTMALTTAWPTDKLVERGDKMDVWSEKALLEEQPIEGDKLV